MKNRIPILLGAACLAQILTMQPAQAQSDYQESSISVSYAELDLNSEAGANAMLGRLRQAAQRVCSGGFDRELTRGRAERECMRNAMRQAVAAADTAAMQQQYAQSEAGVTTLAAHSSVQMEANGARARISYADLNLDAPQGRAALQRRIESVTRASCGVGRWALRLSRSQRECQDDARAQADVLVAQAAATQLAQAGAPALQASAAPAAQMTLASASTTATTPQPTNVVTLQNTAATTGYGVCDARIHAANFSRGSNILSAQVRSNLAAAVDAASVCQLESAIVAVDSSDPLAVRRASALRAALISRGVPAERVTINYQDAANVQGAEVRMTFNGVAHGGSTEAPQPAPVA